MWGPAVRDEVQQSSVCPTGRSGALARRALTWLSNAACREQGSCRGDVAAEICKSLKVVYSLCRRPTQTNCRSREAKQLRVAHESSKIPGRALQQALQPCFILQIWQHDRHFVSRSVDRRFGCRSRELAGPHHTLQLKLEIAEASLRLSFGRFQREGKHHRVPQIECKHCGKHSLRAHGSVT